MEKEQTTRSAEEVHTVMTAAFQVLFREIADLRAWISLLQGAVAGDKQAQVNQQVSLHFHTDEHLAYREEVAQSLAKKIADRLAQLQGTDEG